jgi:NAD(P)H-dependent FMN reductase
MVQDIIEEKTILLSNKETSVKKILLLAGSNSPNSINRKVIEYTAGLFKHNETTIIDLRDYPLPIYSVEIEEKEGIPGNAFALNKIFNEHDAVVFSVAEHNGSITAFFKNALDWISRTQKNYRILENKPVLLLSASITPSGGRDAASHAELIFSKRLRGRVIDKVSIPKFFDKVKVTGSNIIIIDEEIDNHIRNSAALLENELK